MTRITLDRIAEMMEDLRLHPGQEIRYASGRNEVAFSRYSMRDLVSGRTTSVYVRRGAAELEIPYQKLFSAVEGAVPERPFNMEAKLGGSGNDRTVMQSLLLLAPEFFKTKRDGRAMVVWCPSRPHAPGEMTEWVPTGDWELTREMAAGAVDHALKSGVYDRESVEDAVSALRARHLALCGPPGTGKNHLVQTLCGYLGIQLVVATATPEWTSHSVTGWQSVVDGKVRFVPGPLVEAMERCERSMVAERRPTWLFIDELNRCDPDQALGQLMTVLGEGTGTGGGSIVVQTDPARKERSFPPGFRIVTAYNETDGDSVRDLSAAVKRRFAICDLSCPPNEEDGTSNRAEWDHVASAAPRSVGLSGADADAVSAVLGQAAHAMRAAAGICRTHLGGIATGQLTAWAAGLCSREHCFPGSPPVRQADRAAASTVLKAVQTAAERRSARGSLDEDAFRAAVGHIRGSGLVGLAASLEAAVIAG